MSRRSRRRRSDRRLERGEPSKRTFARYQGSKLSKKDLSSMFPHEIDRYQRNERIARFASLTTRPVLAGRSRFNPGIFTPGVQEVVGKWAVGVQPKNRREQKILEDARICAERRRRREVLHAFSRTGKGSGGGPKEFTSNSKVRC